MKKKKLIILAAGQGTRLKPLTDNMPKCMVPLAGKNLLDWKIETALKAGMASEDIIIVGGYKAEQIQHNAGRVLINPRYAETNMVQTLWCAREYFGESIIIAYGDIVYTEEVFNKMLSCQHQIGIAVDHDWLSYWEQRFQDVLSDAESLSLDGSGKLTGIGQQVDAIGKIEGQYIGLMIFQDEGIHALSQLYEKELSCFEKGLPGMAPSRNLNSLYMTDMLQGLIENGSSLYEIPIKGGWVEIDNLSDLELANSFCFQEGSDLKIVRNHAH